MPATEFTAGGLKYRAEPLSAFEQWDVARRFSPVLIWLGNMKRAATADQPLPADDAFARAIVALSAGLTKDDADSAVGTCLNKVSRQQEGGGWAPIRAAGRVMFDDIALMDMMKIVYRVLDANKLPDFFSAPPLSTGAAATG